MCELSGERRHPHSFPTRRSSDLLTATIEDAQGNTVTSGGDSTLAVTFSKTAGAGTVTGLGSPNAVAGVATDTVTEDPAAALKSQADLVWWRPGSTETNKRSLTVV